jgi:hypothetical protein
MRAVSAPEPAEERRPEAERVASRLELVPINDLRAIVREEVEIAVKAVVAELRALLASHTTASAGIEPLLEVAEVAKIGGVLAKTVRKYMREGKLKRTWFGNEMRVAPKDLESFVRESTRAAEPENMDAQADKILGKIGRR